MKNSRSFSLFLSTVLAVTLGIAGCGQKAMYRGEIKEQKLVPLQYPNSALTPGAMIWGNPGGTIESFRPGPDNLSEELEDALPTADAAWFGQEKSSKVFLGVVAQPGPEVLTAIKAADAKGGAALTRESFKFVDWGTLTERSIDIERLSKAIVRGWYNMPGESLRFDALTPLRPDMEEYENRPMIVQRSVSSEGLQYEVSAKLSGLVGATAQNPIYGKGAVVTGAESASGTTLKVESPMVIGYNPAELKAIVPPLPFIEFDADQTDLMVHTFKWDVDRFGDREAVIDPKVLLAEARRLGLESNVPEVTAPAETLVADVKTGQPAKLSVYAEAKPRSGAEPWRRLGEGNVFDASELVRLRIYLEEPSYLYIMNKDSDGKAAILYPKVTGSATAIGEDAPVGPGTFDFPGSVISAEGMTFSAGEGTENFIVVASKTRMPDMLNSFKQFTNAINTATANGSSATRGGVFALPGATRVVTGYASAADTPAGASQEAYGEIPVYSAPSGATLMTLNLNKVPAP